MDYNIIDILLENEIYDNYHVENNYSEIKDEQFLDLLLKYKEKQSKLTNHSTIDDIREESQLNIYIPQRNYTSYFNKALLSMDSIIIDDVISSTILYLRDFNISNKIAKTDQNPFKKAKNDVALFILYLKENAALICNGSIKFISSKSEIYESNKKRKLLINASDESEILKIMPKSTINIYKESIIARPIEYVGGNNHFKFLNKKNFSGDIIIEIKNCNSHYVNGYRFSTAQTYIDSNGERIINYNSIVPSIPKTRGRFDDWVNGAINRTISEHYTNMDINLTLSNELNASLGYDCNFTNKILNSINKSNSSKRKMLEIKTPFLNGINSDMIAKIKNDYGPSFDAYKKILRDSAFEMDVATDPHHIDIINQRFKERVSDEGIKEVERTISALKKSAISNIAIDIGLAVLGIMGSKITPAALIGAVAGPVKTAYLLHKDFSTIKRHPSYFLLKTQKK